MSVKKVLLEKEGEITIVTINRPDALNTLSTDVLERLDDILDRIEKDRKLAAVIITGAGEKAFAAGADVSEMKEFTPLQAQDFARRGQEIFMRIENLKIPVIAAINGYALGGGLELAMCCDLRIASPEAVFGQPEVQLGIIPGFGGTQRLPRLIGPTRAKEIIFTGKKIDAGRAEEIGLINKVAVESALKEAKDMAKSITENGRIAVNLAKDSIRKGLQMDINSGGNYEAAKFSLCFSTEDQKEGMEAFIERRQPEFRNK